MSVKVIAGYDIPPNPNPPIEEHTFSELVAGRIEEFPLLAKSSNVTRAANSPEITWLDSHGRQCVNYCQIVRWPYDEPAPEGSQSRGGNSSKEQALTEFLSAVERILRYGKPSSTLTKSGMPLRTCGGVRHYLGRDPIVGDRVNLRPLREPFFRTFTHDWVDGEPYEFVKRERPIYEWLAEFSLQVS